MLFIAALTLIAVSQLAVLPVAKAGYVFEILLVEYQNPTHKTHNGRHCEPGNRDDFCDNAFMVCVSEREKFDCGIGELETIKIAENNDNLMFSEGQTYGGVSNPLTMSADEPWPGQIKIRFSIYDIDGHYQHIVQGNSDLITEFIINPDVVPSSNGDFTNQSHYSTSTSDLWLAFRLTCTYPYSGENCSEIISSSSYSFHYPSSSPTIGLEDGSYSLKLQPTSSSRSMQVIVVQGAADRNKGSGNSLPLGLIIVVIIIAVALLVILSVFIAVVIVKIRRKKQRKAIITLKYDDSAFKLSYMETSKRDPDEHIYETVKESSSSSASNPPPPIYSAVNPTYSTTEEEHLKDNSDVLTLQKNLAYASSIEVQRSRAYSGMGRDLGDCPMLPLPPTV